MILRWWATSPSSTNERDAQTIPQIVQLRTWEHPALCWVQASQQRPEHRMHPYSSPEKKSTVCGTSRSRNPLNPHALTHPGKSKQRNPAQNERKQRRWGGAGEYRALKTHLGARWTDGAQTGARWTDGAQILLSGRPLCRRSSHPPPAIRLQS